MANGDGMTYGCHCGKPWMSILPPPPCPYHQPPRWDGWLSGSVTTICRGRHCAHDAKCFPVQYAVTWNG